MLVEATSTLWVAAVGKHLVALCRRTGTLSSAFEATSTIRFLSAEDAAASPSSISSSSSSILGRIAIVTEDKKLITLALHETRAGPDGSTAGAVLTQLDEVRVPKRGTGVVRLSLTNQGTQSSVLCVSDKWGDVHAFPDPHVSAKRRTLMTHTGCIITALAASLDSRFVISADREERIRVSHFPHAFNIQSYCLGHSKFVSAMRVLRQAVKPGAGFKRSRTGASNPIPAELLAQMTPTVPSESSHSGYGPGELLVSGGGDGTMRLFHWFTGTLLHTLYLQPGERLDYGVPYIFGGSTASGEGSSETGAVATPADAIDVFTGVYGSFTSVGAHADAAMNAATADEDEGGGEGESTAKGSSTGAGANASAGGAVDEGLAEEPEGKRRRVGSLTTGKAEGGEAVEAPTASTAAPTADGAGITISATGGKATTSIPKAYNVWQAQSSGPPVFPVTFVECASTGILASIVEGEHAVRLFSVYMEAEPDRIPVAVGHEEAVSKVSSTTPAAFLPQARLAQVGVHVLATRPLSLAFDPLNAAVLLVGTLLPQEGGSGGFAYQQLAFHVRKLGRDEKVAAADAAGDYTGYVLEACGSTPLPFDIPTAVNELLRDTTRLSAEEASKVRASYFAEGLDAYDQTVKNPAHGPAAGAKAKPDAAAHTAAAETVVST